MSRSKWVRVAVVALLCTAAGGVPVRSSAQAVLDIKPQPLRNALQAFGEQTGLQILFRSEGLSLEGRTTPGVSGTLSAQAALDQLLRETGLEYEFINERTVRISAPVANPQSTVLDEPGAGINIEEIIVTARHREEKLREVPMGITALTGEVLNKAQRRSFEDYAALVPGMSLLQGGNGIPGGNRLSLRGLNAQGVGATVAVYVDDSPFGSSSGAVNGATFASNFDPWDMQRIEVLRGPQGMFYGASSEGGLIKFVTNPPDVTELAGTVELGAENVHEGDNGWSGKGMLNVPLGEQMAVRVSAYSQRLAGFVDDTQRNERDVNEGQKDGVRVSFLAAPSNDLEIRLTGFEQDLQMGSSPNVDVDPVTRRPVDGAFTQRRVLDERSIYRYSNYNASLNWNLGWASVFASSSYGSARNRPFVDLTLEPFMAGLSYSEVVSDPNNYADQSGPLPTGPLGVYLTNEAKVKKLTQELRLQSPASERLEWDVGAFYTRETGNLRQPFPMVDLADGSPFGPPGYALLLSTLDSKFEEWAGFGSVTYSFSPRFEVQVGGRWARNEQTSLSRVSSEFLGIPLTAIDGEASAHKFLYSVAPSWNVSDELLVYGRVASGYQPGGANLLPPNAPPEVPSQYQPDTTVNYEIGFRTQLFDRRVSLDVAAFWIDWTKVQLNQIIISAAGDFGIIGNGGKAISRGVEWTASWMPLDALSFTWTGAYIDATLTSDAPVVGGEDGDRLPNSPRWSSSLDGEYAWNAFAGHRMYVGGTFSYTGVQVSSFSTFSDARTRVPGYTLLNLRAGLQARQWTIALYAKNVANKRAALLFADSGDPLFPGSIIFNQPRTVGIAVSTHF